ncbi:MAG TPA: FHA domain-containing protein [bacterium]|nr:FHA domain-containing protein [bacterium]
MNQLHAHIEVHDPRGMIHQFSIPEPGISYSLGRLPSNDFTVPHESISGKHLMIQWCRPDSMLIRDLGSTNGVTVNGVELTGTAEVYPDDRIRIGALSMSIHLVQKKRSVEQEIPPPPDVSIRDSSSPKVHSRSEFSLLLGGLFLLTAAILAFLLTRC